MKRKDEISSLTSCLNKADDDEPIFVLRANDPLAPSCVRNWAYEAEETGEHESEKIHGARKLANDMETWRLKNK